MSEFRKSLKSMIQELIEKEKIKSKNSELNKKNTKLKKINSEEYKPTPSVDELFEHLELRKDQYYRYVRAGSKNDIQQLNLNKILKYIQKHHNEIYSKYLLVDEFDLSLKAECYSHIDKEKDLLACDVCSYFPDYYCYVSNKNEKTKYGVSSVESADNSVKIYLCDYCIKRQDVANIIRSSYHKIVKLLLEKYSYQELSLLCKVNSSTIYRINSFNKKSEPKVNVIDKNLCLALLRLSFQISPRKRISDEVINLLAGKLSNSNFSEKLVSLCYSELMGEMIKCIQSFDKDFRIHYMHGLNINKHQDILNTQYFKAKIKNAKTVELDIKYTPNNTITNVSLALEVDYKFEMKYPLPPDVIVGNDREVVAHIVFVENSLHGFVQSMLGSPNKEEMQIK